MYRTLFVAGIVILVIAIVLYFVDFNRAIPWSHWVWAVPAAPLLGALGGYLFDRKKW